MWRRHDALAVKSRSQVQEQLERGRWVGAFRATYIEATGDVTVGQRELAAVLATCPRGLPPEVDGVPTAVACLRSAARVWGLTLINDDDPATGGNEHLWHDVSTDRNLARESTPTAEGHVIFRHRLTFVRGDFVRLAPGLWVTTPLRTALDCAARLPLDAAVCLLDNGLRRRLFTEAELQAGVAARAQWPGVRRIAQAVSLADRRAESAAETLARLLLLPHLPGLVPQVKISNLRGAVIARADLGDKAVRLAVEADGKRWHAGEPMVAKDRARDRKTEALGWYTERITWHELRCQQAAVIARVVARHRDLLQRAA